MCKFTRLQFNCYHTALYTTPMHTSLCPPARDFNIRQGRTGAPAPCFPLQSDVNNPTKIAATHRIFTVCEACEYTDADLLHVEELEKEVEDSLAMGIKLMKVWEGDLHFRFVMRTLRHDWLHAFSSKPGSAKFNRLFLDDWKLAEECVEYLHSCVDPESEYEDVPRAEFLRDIDVAERVLKLAKMKMELCVEVMRLVEEGELFGVEMEEVGDRLQASVEIEAEDDEGEELPSSSSVTDGMTGRSDPEDYSNCASTSEREYVDTYFDHWLDETYDHWGKKHNSVLNHPNKHKPSTAARGWTGLTVDIVPAARVAGLPEVVGKYIDSATPSLDESESDPGSSQTTFVLVDEDDDDVILPRPSLE
ncbi:hypothetical protein BDV96DRAFT_600702 [Lophiotrema nucula]|uniref:Uncharacterized protein n=1 Tax=Lophiotrema nucula TaxID=690887 RepID=A0A6A5Z3G8_9PLEO|nr:hypothetical protein BDV96DRAFT_600702 [Lophiotrema nucula]